MRKLLGALKNRTLRTLSSSCISATKRSQMTHHKWVRKSQSYLANEASKDSRCQMKASKLKSRNCLSHSSETLCQSSAQWPKLKGMMCFSLHHTTPICSRSRLCGQILKVDSAGNTPHRQPLNEVLVCLE